MFRVLQGAVAHPILNPEHPNLRAFWTFDDIDGTTVRDSSRNGNDGTLVNSPTIAAGYHGNGMETFTTGAKYMSAPITTVSNLQAGAVSMWVKLAAGQLVAVALTDSATPNRLFVVTVHMGIGPGSIWTYYANGTSASTVQYIGDTACPADTWTHILVNHDGTNLDFYQDGTLMTKTLDSANDPDETLWYGDVSSPDDLTIGSMLDNTPNYFNGEYDSIRIFNRGLTQDEITTLANE